ncbi:hypothetical protein GOODEAATRI_031508 [Goodea atripinnis]|uniref:Uncharacterized protein n=1 Tax=Goodea atripinnis TaxID=208336 RepID=A0ABV0P9C5_9TELE
MWQKVEKFKRAEYFHKALYSGEQDHQTQQTNSCSDVLSFSTLVSVDTLFIESDSRQHALIKSLQNLNNLRLIGSNTVNCDIFLPHNLLQKQFADSFLVI